MRPESMSNLPDTFPKLLIQNARRFADRPAIREKEYGIWQTWTWEEVRAEVFAFAAGLRELGFVQGDKMAIIGRNRPRLYWSITAVQCLGGIPVPVYADSVAEEMEYVLNHAGVRFVLAEDQEQVDKVLEVSDRIEGLEQIVYDDSRGLQGYNQTKLHDFSVVQDIGRTQLEKDPRCLTEAIEGGKGSDVGIFLYTSGTTGKPKGVVLTHDNIILSSRSSVEFEQLTEMEETLSYLPIAWVGDHVFSHGQAYVAGYCINCPENEETVATDLREIGPTYYFAPPRVFEGILTHVMIRMEDASRWKQKLFHYFLQVARETGGRILNGEPVSFRDRMKYLIGNLLVYAPLKNTMGFSHIKLAYTAGEAIGPEIFDFYRSLGINIKQLYGQTEGTVFVTIQPNGEVYADTVGVPAPGVEIEITDAGEVKYRSPGVFQQYYRNEAATRETKDVDGWVHTGDAGYMDDRGHLHIIDRAKDVGRLNDGSMFAPKYLENKLKFFPQIKEVVTFGHQCDFVTAFVNIDLDAVSNWAERHNIPYASYQELAGRSEVYDLIEQNILQTNASLATDTQMSGAQIRRFLVLHKELDPDDGEMTRTRKVRRNIIQEKYQTLVQALYSDVKSCHVSTEVTFEDGRKGQIEADIAIREVEIYPPIQKFA